MILLYFLVFIYLFILKKMLELIFIAYCNNTYYLEVNLG